MSKTKQIHILLPMFRLNMIKHKKMKINKMETYLQYQIPSETNYY